MALVKLRVLVKIYVTFFIALVLFTSVSDCSNMIIYPGPKFEATKGEVWPKPQIQHKYSQYYTLEPKKFEFITTDQTCDLLGEAMQRYWHIIVAQHGQGQRRRVLAGRQPRSRRHNTLDSLRVQLAQPCEHLPHLDMDESYELSIGRTADGDPAAVLDCRSVWGAMRGLETFSQLLRQISDRDNTLIVNATYIRDYPRFQHRGLLVDTSRHFLSMYTLLQIIDGMAYNKLNVLHWHIVDDQSFPYQSIQFSTLSDLGAYHPTAMVYSPQDVQTIIGHARARGIRILPEFDVPGHTRSWGEAFPSLLASCYKKGKVVGLGPMNPTSEATYKFLKQFFEEVMNVFPDDFFHFGGDEVDYSCWESNPSIRKYMRRHNVSNGSDLQTRFLSRVLSWPRRPRPVLWQEAADGSGRLPTDVVVQIWKDSTSDEITMDVCPMLTGRVFCEFIQRSCELSLEATIGTYSMSEMKLTEAGYRVLFSSCWYLDQLTVDWDSMYSCDPCALLPRPELESLVLGGEACMWAELVDNNNVLPRIFPRASAAAERLWSSREVVNLNEAAHRLEEHACRMSLRGIPAQPPNGPGYCI